jgi:ankyrin repeat protein
VIIISGMIFNINLWHWLIVYPIWGLIYVVVILMFIKPAIMDSQVWTNYEAAEKLIYPITEGDVERVITMVENGAKINVRRAYGYTPLMIAAGRGDLEIVKILVNHGAHLNPRDRDDRKTALVMAYTNGHYDVADYLINQGAWINLEDIRGQTLLFHAIDSLEFFTFLVKRGADLRRTDSWGRDILSHAIYHNKPEIVRFLRNQGMEFRRYRKNRKIPGVTEGMIFQALECAHYNTLAYYLAVEGDTEDLKELDKAATEACQCKMKEVSQILGDLGARVDCDTE